MSQSQYPFLEILRESEGLARGANITEKLGHGVYKTMQSMTTVAHARRNQLFTLDTPVPDIVNLTRKSLATIVSRLIGDHLVAQIFRLEYDPGTPEPVLVSCYITHPADEHLSPVVIYNETIMASVQALESLLNALPAVTPEAVTRDLKADLETETNRPLKLPAHLVDLFGSVHASKFDLVPAPELVQRTIADIRAELQYRGRVLDLLNYGPMPLRDMELLERLETAIDFLMDTIIPRYRSKGAGSLKRALEAIGMDESAYHLDPFAPPTPDFAMRRAEAVRHTLQAEPGYRGGRFQGGLALEIIVGLGPLAKQKYLDRHQKELARLYREFREKLVNVSNDWQDTILFLGEDEKEKLPPEVFRELVADPEILYSVWHRPEGVVHVFLRRSPDAFRAVVRALSIVSPERAWQALSVKTILEEHEGDYRFLFDDPNFLLSYGAMLRRVYLAYIPWYLRLLLVLGINFFQDYSFQLAKKSIQTQQAALALANRARGEERQKEQEARRHAELNRIREASAANQILEQLDAAYTERGRVPSVGEIQADLAASAKMEEATFQEILRKENFQLAPAVGKEASPQDAVLLYPLNHEWRTRAARLRRILDRILQDQAADPVQVDRARRAQKLINRASAGGAAAGARPASESADGSGEEDAFERFGEELEKHETREKKRETGKVAAAGGPPPDTQQPSGGRIEDLDAPEV